MMFPWLQMSSPVCFFSLSLKARAWVGGLNLNRSLGSSSMKTINKDLPENNLKI